MIQKKSWEGSVSPYTHYLNIRNHIYFIKKHNLDFNLIGVWIYQFFKIFSYILYFTIKLRFVKLKMVYKGLIDGLNYKRNDYLIPTFIMLYIICIFYTRESLQ